MTLADIIADRNDLFTERNAEGAGFTPGPRRELGALVHMADTDDDVSVYDDGDTAVLVADANGRWAVRVEVD